MWLLAPDSCACGQCERHVVLVQGHSTVLCRGSEMSSTGRGGGSSRARSTRCCGWCCTICKQTLRRRQRRCWAVINSLSTAPHASGTPEYVPTRRRGLAPPADAADPPQITPHQLAAVQLAELAAPQAPSSSTRRRLKVIGQNMCKLGNADRRSGVASSPWGRREGDLKLCISRPPRLPGEFGNLKGAAGLAPPNLHPPLAHVGYA